MKAHAIFFVEVTDTYGGESNYSWVHRFKVHATTYRGAMRKVSKHMGFNAKLACNVPYCRSYKRAWH